MREYREAMSVLGQASPIFLTQALIPHLHGTTIIDVGCGSGLPVSIIRSCWSSTASWRLERKFPERIVGLDFSATAITYASKFGAYDEVRLANAGELPATSAEFETALSMENLEHLWIDELGGAIEELIRVSSREVLITTPWPWEVINKQWLIAELKAAVLDTEVM